MRPATGNARAFHKKDLSFVARYCADENIDIDPQTPFMMVTRSARRKFLAIDQSKEV